MNHILSAVRRSPVIYCTLCGCEILTGEEYWFCNGASVCAACLPVFARQELAPCREICGKETHDDAF